MTEREVSVLRGSNDFVSLPDPTGRKVWAIPVPGSTFVDRDAVARAPGCHLSTYDVMTHNINCGRYHHEVPNLGVQPFSERTGDSVHEAELRLKLKLIRGSGDTDHGSKFNIAFLPPQSAREYHLQRENGSIATTALDISSTSSSTPTSPSSPPLPTPPTS